MPPRLVPTREQELRSDFELSFCINLVEHLASESIPVLWLGENPETTPLIVDQYRGELRLRFHTDTPDQFGSLRHEVSLGRFCGARCFDIQYLPGRLVVLVDGVSFVMESVTGHFVTAAVDRERLDTNKEFWQGRLNHVSWNCARP